MFCMNWASCAIQLVMLHQNFCEFIECCIIAAGGLKTSGGGQRLLQPKWRDVGDILIHNQKKKTQHVYNLQDFQSANDVQII